MSIKDDMEDVQEAVINELITENGITNTLADGQVTETKILNGAVTAAKLGSDVALGQVNNGAVTTAKIADDAVTLAKLGSDVDLGQVNDGAVTPAKLSQAYLPLTGGSVSGNLLVGKTVTAFSTAGTLLAQNGEVNITKSGDVPLYVHRLDSDGQIIRFVKDNTHVGSIGTLSGNLFIGSTNGSDAYLGFSNTFVLPVTSTGANRDNAISLGNAAARFDDIFATNGTIQTSDANEKQDIEALSEAEQRVAVACKGLLRKFRWKSSVEENGAEARIHFGIIAQDLQAAFEAEGLDAGRYAMFISSTWTDEETEEEKTRLGVRYSELLAFIISAI